MLVWGANIPPPPGAPVNLTPATDALIAKVTRTAAEAGYAVKLTNARSDGEHDYAMLLFSSGSGRKFRAEGWVDVGDGRLLTNSAKPSCLRRSIDSLVGGA